MNRHIFSAYCFLQLFFLFLGAMIPKGIGFILIPTFILVSGILLVLGIVTLVARGNMKWEDVVHFFKVLINPPPMDEFYDDDDDDDDEDGPAICDLCGKEKEWFYYTFELPPHEDYNHLEQICTDCAKKY